MDAFREILCVVAITVPSHFLADGPPARKEPITEDEALAFCTEFAKRFKSGDGIWLTDHIDSSGMMWRATEGKNDPIAQRYRRNASRMTHGVSKFVEDLVPRPNTIKRYTFKQLQNVDGIWKGLFRLDHEIGGIIFHEVNLDRGTHGEIHVTEFYNFAMGESMTDTFKSFYQAEQQERNAGPNGEQELQANVARVEKIWRAYDNKRYQSVIDLYEQSSIAVKKKKFIQQLRLQSAIIIKQNAYFERAFNEYSDNFPKDPSLDLLLIDLGLVTKKAELGIQAADRLIERTGKDGALLLSKALLYAEDGRPAEAIRCAREGLELEPDFERLFFITLGLSLRIKDHALTKEMIETLESRFSVHFKDLKQDAPYADFVKSPEYEAYLKEREQASGDAKPEF